MQNRHLAVFTILILTLLLFSPSIYHARAAAGDNTLGSKKSAGSNSIGGQTIKVHIDTPAVMNYLNPLARTRVPRSVLIKVADNIARTLAAEPGIPEPYRRSWIDTRSGKPVYRLNQVGNARWAGQVPASVQKAVRKAIDRISYQDPIGLFAFDNPFSYNRDRKTLSPHYPKRFSTRMPASTGAITGEWLISGADGLFDISRLYQGKPFSIEKHRRILEKYQILAASYSRNQGRAVSYHYFWFEKAPPGWKEILKDLPQGQGLEKIGPPVSMAPDHINKAASMIYGYKAEDAASAGSPEETPDLPARLENPDGLYSVTEQGIFQCKVLQKGPNNSYKVHWHVVMSKEPTLRPGQLVRGGWWYPSFQQFHTEPHFYFGQGHSCNGWRKKEWAQWSDILEPDILMTGQGMSYPGYRYTGKSPAERRHASRVCEKVLAERPGCKISCINWLYGNRIPEVYLLWNKDQAVSLYHYLNTRGARVTPVSVIKAQNQAAWKAKQAEKQQEAAKEEKVRKATRHLSEKRGQVDFPGELSITPALHDILLAKFYPKRLDRQMLEAMMSSRWSYEKTLDLPLGGRFFKKGGQAPTYEELGLLSPLFKEWILARARALPETLILDTPLIYDTSGARIGTPCLVFLKQDGSPAGTNPHQARKAKQDIEACEAQNRRALEAFNRCQGLRSDLVKAKQHLAEVRAGGCKKPVPGDPANSSSGPCTLSVKLTMANFRTEMMNCIHRTCGTPKPGADIQAYQKCVQDVSTQFKNEMARMMGQPVRPQPKAEPKDACQAAAGRVAQIEKSLTLNQCSALTTQPPTKDCRRIAGSNRPKAMIVGRINLELMLKCKGKYSVFHHGFRESAALLPGNKPFIRKQFSFMLYPDQLILPHDLPAGAKKDGAGMVRARIHLKITGPDPRSFRRHQLGLKVVVKKVDYKDN